MTYQYDASSNRMALNRANSAAVLIPTAVSSTNYDAVNEQTQFNGVTQTFDANGNLTNDGTNTYMWDARNRLMGITGEVTASFVYDGLGRRKSKTIGGTNTGFWYDGNDILSELNGSTPSATYMRSLSIDEPFIRKQSECWVVHGYYDVILFGFLDAVARDRELIRRYKVISGLKNPCQ